MSEKTKSSLKKVVIYLLILALGIAIGVMAIKGSENYKNTFYLSERMTFDAYHLLTSLDSAFDNDLPYDRLLEDLTNLNYVASMAIASDGVFLVGYDEDMSYEELSVLYDCAVKAKFIAKDLVMGKDVSSEDMEWFEKFGIAVDTAYAFGPNYRTFIQSLVEQGLCAEG